MKKGEDWFNTGQVEEEIQNKYFAHAQNLREVDHNIHKYIYSKFGSRLLAMEQLFKGPQ